MEQLMQFTLITERFSYEGISNLYDRMEAVEDRQSGDLLES